MLCTKRSLSDHIGYFSSLCIAGDDLDSRRLDLFVHRIAIKKTAETVGSILTCCFRARISGHIKGTEKLPTASSKHWRGSLAPSCLNWRTSTGPSAPEESQQMKVTECHSRLGLWLRRWWFLGRLYFKEQMPENQDSNLGKNELNQTWHGFLFGNWEFMTHLQIYMSVIQILFTVSLLESFFVVSMFIEGRDQTYAVIQSFTPILIYRRSRNH